MGAFSRILVLLMFGGLGLTAYAGSVAGWGIGGLTNQKTMEEIRTNCPEYYQNRNGDCLRTTFRSYYLVYGMRGGGFGGGK